MSALVDMKDACDAKVRRFTRLLRRYDPTAYPPSALITYKSSWTSEATNALEELVDAIEELCSKNGQTLGSVEVGVWKESIKRNEAEFQKFINGMEAKTADIPGPNMGPMVPAHSDSNLIQAQKTRAAQVEIEIDMQIISTKGTQLSTEILKFDDWGDAPDNDIEIAMNKVDDWKRKMEKLREKSYAIQRNTMSFNLDQSTMRSSKALVNTLSSELDIVVDNIQFEDGKRCLYSQNRSKVAAVKFPTFGGDIDEDFSKFEKEVKKAFSSNRVRRDDQVSKLRECLKRHPKSLIPSSMDNIEDAWKVLKTIFGDAARTMKAKQAKIASMGRMPRNETNRVQLELQIEWLIKLELTLQDIFDIGEQSVNMDRAAFGPELVDMVYNLFHFEVQKDFTSFDVDDDKDRLACIFDYIIKMRLQRQFMLRSCESGGDADPAYSDAEDSGDGDRQEDPGGGADA